MPHTRDITHSPAIVTRPPASTPVVALASGLGGLADAVVSNAPRVIKVRAQLQLPPPPANLHTVVHGLPLYGSVSALGNLWCYTVQHLVKAHLGDTVGPFVAATLSGLGAGMSEAWVSNPARRILVRHAAEQPQQSLRQAAVTLWREEGAAGMWRGAPMAAVRSGLAWATFFATLQALRQDGQPKSMARNVVDSSVACAVACLVGTPLDTVVTHMQGHGGRAPCKRPSRR